MMMVMMTTSAILRQSAYKYIRPHFPFSELPTASEGGFSVVLSDGRDATLQMIWIFWGS